MACECKGKLNVRKPQFYQVFSPSSTSQSLRIPDGFVHQMEGTTCGLVSLTGPSGNNWQVRLVEQDNYLFFHHGWSTFVGDHHLEYGDLLVFRYEGHLHFTVQVFGENACEKEAAFHTECNLNSINFDNIEGQKSDAKETSSLDVVSDQQGIAGRDLSKYEVVKPISMIREREETYKECSTSAVPVPFHTVNSNEDQASLSMLSAHDEKKIAQSFTSSFPYFVKIMKTFNVSGSYTLNIPYQFSTSHLPNCKIKIILHNLKGEHWTVNSVPTTRVHTSHTLCGGWMAFVRGNSIKVGDVCIFELIHEYELRVRIAEVGKDGLDSQVGKLAYSMLTARHDVACHKTSRYMSKSPKVSSKCRSKVDQSDKLSKIGQDAVLSIDLKKSGRASNTSKKMGLSPKSKAVHKKLAVPRKHRVEDELSSQAKAGLRMLFALDEQRVAEAFSSPFPNFVKIMKKFNVSGSYTLVENPISVLCCTSPRLQNRSYTSQFKRRMLDCELCPRR
ncbi:B3 domain-containing protein Os03g0619600-like isoform X2 [Trifolium pratense]|uniref:B3 domain-containing protein Os03g0619600-like isoform X2 n=1 Tax=Trifolium pratense TaxID=57577 RepID=UPI001E694749|nr:B3 domain-containing protein Os03g0619600-like isoform X2 [Trifolium pratense]XP_045791273.1 B3 domain-containing protein Os03g0619600-like isoform X2 [Trifolium pratense]